MKCLQLPLCVISVKSNLKWHHCVCQTLLLSPLIIPHFYFRKTPFCSMWYFKALPTLMMMVGLLWLPSGTLTASYFSVVWSKMAPFGPAHTATWWWFPEVKRALRTWQQAACSGRTPVEWRAVMPASCVKLGSVPAFLKKKKTHKNTDKISCQCTI